MAKNYYMLRRVALFLITVYQWVIRPVLPASCRFNPSCSEYAKTAFEKKGFFIGLKLTILRLLRCHPWSEGGYDPVLPNKEKP